MEFFDSLAPDHKDQVVKALVVVALLVLTR